jgi:hypothetical protein
MSLLDYRPFNSKAFSQLNLPLASKHSMVSIRNRDVMMVTESRTKKNEKIFELHYVSNVTSLNDMHLGLFHDKESYQKPILNPPISHRNNFSFVNFSDEMYLFGGATNQIFDDLYTIKLPLVKSSTGGYSDYHFQTSKIEKTKEQCWPTARFGHLAEITIDSMIIYGGNDGKRQLNDIFIFNIHKGEWNEILTTVSPPPTIFSSLVSINENSLVLYGGLLEKETTNIALKLSLSKDSSEWNFMEIPSNSDEEFGLLQIPLIGHQCSVVGQHLYILGGSDGENILDNAITINQISDVGSEFLTSKILRDMRNKQKYCDITFLLKNINGKTCEIKAHKCILAKRSEYFAKLLQEAEGESTITIEDCFYETLEAYVDFIYYGTLNLNSSEFVKLFLDFIQKNTPGKYSTFLDICSTNSFDLLLSHEIIEDFNFLSLKHDDLYSDIKLKLDNETVIPCHRVMLSKSPYFRKMFDSGMIESYSDEIELEGVQKSVFLQILNYLYLDTNSISNSNCVGVLIQSLMFELTDLSTKCRNVVEKNLNPSIACQLTSIADLYGDMSLKRICVKYLKLNFEKVQHLEEFQELDQDLKTEIKISGLKIKERNDKKK